MATLLTFDTTHHALWAEEVALTSGIPVDLVPAPAAARARCNLAVETLPESLEALKAALEREGVPYGIYVLKEEGNDPGSRRASPE